MELKKIEKFIELMKTGKKFTFLDWRDDTYICLAEDGYVVDSDGDRISDNYDIGLLEESDQLIEFEDSPYLKMSRAELINELQKRDKSKEES